MAERMRVQRKRSEGGERAPARNSSDLLTHSLANPSRGEALEPGARAFLEPRFGHSFANIRIHADGEADRLAKDFEARAFTTGQDIYFRAGAYAPDSLEGMHLLSHELTHTIQQADLVSHKPEHWSEVQVGEPGGTDELIADQRADSVVGEGYSVPPPVQSLAGSGGGALVQREDEHHRYPPTFTDRLANGVSGLMNRRWVDNEMGDAGLKTGAAVLGALPLGASAVMAHGADEMLDATNAFAQTFINPIGRLTGLGEVPDFWHPGLFSRLGGRGQ